MSNVKKETISGAKWGMLQKLTMQPLQTVYGMLLARLITPEEMGIMGLTAIFFAVAAQLSSAGFGTALIRKQNRSEEDKSTVFWFNLVMSLLLSIGLFLLAPWFSNFYKQPELLWLTRVSAIMMLLNSSAGVHWTLYQCRRDFKTPAIVSSITSIAGMPVCLTLAWLGWGVWALMWQGVFSSLLSLCIIWKISPWKPRFIFSRSSFQELFTFGSKVALANMVHVIYTNIRTFIIGKFYSPAQLGLYSRGEHLASMVPTTITGIMGSVTYPILATIQSNDARLFHAYRKYIKVSTLVIAICNAALISMATPAIRLLYGEIWVPCAIFLQIVAIAYCTDHIAIINLNLLMVKGRSDLLLRLEIIKKSISLSMIIVGATISVEAICWAGALYAQIAIFINTYYTGKILGLTWWKQQKDYLPYFALAALCCTPAWFITQTSWHSLVQLTAGGSCAFILYFGTLHILKEAAYVELYTTLRGNRWFRWLPAI